MRKGEVIEIQKIIRDYYKQWNEQPRRNGQIPRNIQSFKTESEINRIYEDNNYGKWNWISTCCFFF